MEEVQEHVEEHVEDHHEEPDPLQEKARALGWKPRDEWQGAEPAGGLIEDPGEFIDRAERFAPVRQLQKQVETLEGKLNQTSETLRKIDKVYERQFEQQRAEYDRQLQEARAQQDKAFDEGDKDTYHAAKERERQLMENQPEAPEPEQPQVEVPPDVREAIDNWRVDKDWFGSDPERHDVEKTKQVAQLYAQAMKDGYSSPAAILKRIDQQMGVSEPEPKRNHPPVEEGLNAGGGRVEPFSKLPKEAKDAFRSMVKKGRFEDTKEDRARYTQFYEEA